MISLSVSQMGFKFVQKLYNLTVDLCRRENDYSQVCSVSIAQNLTLLLLLMLFTYLLRYSCTFFVSIFSCQKVLTSSSTRATNVFPSFQQLQMGEPTMRSPMSLLLTCNCVLYQDRVLSKRTVAVPIVWMNWLKERAGKRQQRLKNWKSFHQKLLD